MASIKIPYQYRSFSGAPITTAIEKRLCQSFNPLVFFSGCFFCVPMMIGFAFLGGRKETLLWYIMGFCAFVCIVAMFLFPAVLKHIWVKKKMAEKMAYIEIMGNVNTDEKSNFKKFVAKKLCVFLLPWIFLAFCFGVAQVRPVIYNHQMHSAYADGDYSESCGVKCTVFLVEDDQYTSDLLPVWMTANSPKQVGYILRISTDEYLAGYTEDYNFYTNESKEIPVYMSACTIEWISCASGTVVKTHVIEGSMPTYDSPMVNGAYYGHTPLGGWKFEDEIETVYRELISQ